MEAELAWDYAARMLAFIVDREGAAIDGRYHRDLRLTLTEIVDEMIEALEPVDPTASEGQKWRAMQIRLDVLRAAGNLRR